MVSTQARATSPGSIEYMQDQRKDTHQQDVPTAICTHQQPPLPVHPILLDLERSNTQSLPLLFGFVSIRCLQRKQSGPELEHSIFIFLPCTACSA